MANTTKGFPYPLGTDRVMDGDDAIHALADAVDTKVGLVASGTAVSGVPSALNSAVTVAVTFPVGRFTAPPSITVTALGSTVEAGLLNAPTTEGVNMFCSKKSGSLLAMTCYWIANQ